MKSFIYNSPFGNIELTIKGKLLVKVQPGRFQVQETSSSQSSVECHPGRNVFTVFLDTYFCHNPASPPLEKIDFNCLTPFQLECYRNLLRIIYGERVSYGEFAKMIGRPKAVRAVGRAMAANPFPIFIPCHRVVGADGKTGGFSAGEKWKNALLHHEATCS